EFLGKKINVMPYIPDRVDEGYGLSEISVNTMIDKGAQLIITVDCGIRDRAIVEKYTKEKGIEFIITDHHQPPEDIKEAKYIIVHQMFPENEYPEQRICGSTVAWLLIQAIKETAGMESEINENTQGLDLVGLATVTDMMPLVGVNRVFVKYGLEQMQSNKRKGLKAIIDLAAVKSSELDSYHLGFVIGPRINAAGRIGSAMDALRLLVSQDKNQINELAAKLQNLNIQRQETTKELITLSHQQVRSQINNMMIFVVGENWHEGVIGLVAGRLVEQSGKPSVVLTHNENGTVKGSARSVNGFNITHALEEHSDLLERYGGHAQAAGFSLKYENLEKFQERLIKYANDNISLDLLDNDLYIDLLLDLKRIDEPLYDSLQLLKPFGYGNTKPTIQISNVEVVEKFEMSGGKHLKLKIKQEDVIMNAVMFGCEEDILKINIGDMLDLVGYSSLNEWEGHKEIQIQVKEWRRSIY
ncbi:MAG TPA: single-stranded-DNA-specific exonuclease RecJ, partial [Candidatus Dojkabacteria bacterium]|nr:single-stranded-DNA-specific exonuclease RecJ [Candidatus Dojkabacteria bacterium]